MGGLSPLTSRGYIRVLSPTLAPQRSSGSPSPTRREHRSITCVAVVAGKKQTCVKDLARSHSRARSRECFTRARARVCEMWGRRPAGGGGCSYSAASLAGEMLDLGHAVLVVGVRCVVLHVVRDLALRDGLDQPGPQGVKVSQLRRSAVTRRRTLSSQKLGAAVVALLAAVAPLEKSRRRPGSRHQSARRRCYAGERASAC